VGAADGSIAGLLGASPGASTAVPAMLEVMSRCFDDRYQGWLPTIKAMIPSLGTKLSTEPKLFEEIWARGTEVLKLDKPAGALPDTAPEVSSAGTGHTPTTATV